MRSPRRDGGLVLRTRPGPWCSACRAFSGAGALTDVLEETQAFVAPPRTPARGALDLPSSSPAISCPTLGVFVAALALFAGSSWAAVELRLPGPLTIVLSAGAVFMMFTVVHDAAHSSLSSSGAVNRVFGRVAMLFVSPTMAFPAWRFIHIEHHRWANDDQHDPDRFASRGRWWQLPVHWAVMDAPYVAYYIRHQPRRPRAEVAENAAMLLFTVALVVTACLTGTLWWLVLLYVIPERIALVVLAWWFDWLPHHGLTDTQKENQYRATRARVGMEWLLSPLMLSQNYHLVHHLHPSIPFHRYRATWRKNQEAYLQREAAISTAFGQQLTPEEFRQWEHLNRRLRRVLPARMPRGPAIARSAAFHRLRIDRVDRLTEDSVTISFDIPDALRDTFRFRAGQHVTVRTVLGGEEVRRTYSICVPDLEEDLVIAVKRIPAGTFSTFAVEALQPGDTLELMAPTGRFGSALDTRGTKHYVAIAAGSGITPIMSILPTVLDTEPHSRFTLIYGNRSLESTMFKDTLDDLAVRFSERLEIIHVRSQAPCHPDALEGRIDREKLVKLLDRALRPDAVDEWLLCGPGDLVMLSRATLLEHGVEADHIHIELFSGYREPSMRRGAGGLSTVTLRVAGSEQAIRLAPGDSILEAALQARDDVPYACMGGACGTCKARLVSGTVEMDQNFALGQSDLEAGYVLTCQSHPTSPTIVVDYDG